MTATHATSDWYAWALPIIERLGAMPYGALSETGLTSSRKKQTSYLLKVQCPACDWTARVTAKHIDTHAHLNCPVPDCTGLLMAESEGE